MTAPSQIAFEFAAMLFLLRDRPSAREDLAAQFKRLFAAMGGRGLDLRASDMRLRVDGVPLEDTMPLVGGLRTHLLDRGAGELRLASTVTPAQLLSVMRVLAEPPGRYRSLHEMAISFDPSVREILVLAPPAPDGPVESGDWNAYGEVAVAVAEQAAEVTRPSAAVRVQSLPEHLEAIRRDAAATDVPDRLNEVVRAVDDLVATQDWTGVLQAAAAVVRAEEGARGTGNGRAFGIAIRRMMPRSVVEQVARLVAAPDGRGDAQVVLQRVGADGTEALLALLASSDRMEDRRAYFGALKQMTEGTELLVNMLTHDEWFVVRNVADLTGELRLENAVPRLARHVNHEDERVRRSVAAALGRIAAPGCAEPLRALLRDKAPAVRLAVVQNLDERLRGVAMSVAVAMESEDRPDLVREMLLALGRMGSTESVKVLARAAEAGGRLFKRKPQSTRLAAIEALALTRSPSAFAALQSLVKDPDAAVRQAAARALESGAA
ncbi:MAG TPA: HEAT repeat domain-containing protein [Gemmatimonadales bacterium]|jgi:HEAT repeat protein|nr:HEAT repeat domain-containing protein [Gemmatimonadales bacterium]